jgi:hypothetical protein
MVGRRRWFPCEALTPLFAPGGGGNGGGGGAGDDDDDSDDSEEKIGKRVACCVCG